MVAEQPKVNCSYSELVAPESLKPNPRNPNRHSDGQIRLLSSIIWKLGWRQRIIVSRQSGFIVSGHARREAAILGRMTLCPVEYQDFESPAEETALLLADNQIAELAELDNGLVRGFEIELAQGGFSLGECGFGDLSVAGGKPMSYKDLPPSPKVWVLLGIDTARWPLLAPLVEQAAAIQGCTSEVMAHGAAKN